MLVRIQRALSQVWKYSGVADNSLFPEPFEHDQETLKEILSGIYKQILIAYKENDLSSVQKWVEPGLFKKMVTDFNQVKEKGGEFEFVEKETEYGFFNMGMIIGVNIDRQLNLPKKTYLEILDGEAMNDQLDLNGEELERLKKMVLYVHPKAPTNVIVSLILRCNQGVRVLSKPPTQEIDWHLIKFECEMLRTRDQAHTMLSGEFQSLISMLERSEIIKMRKDWVITDINNTLLGNPYVID